MPDVTPNLPSAARPTAVQTLKFAKAAAGRGDLIRAYDLVEDGLKSDPGDRELQHYLVLMLARMGATEAANEQYRQFKLDAWDHDDSPALLARLEKDRALALPEADPRRPILLKRTALLYKEAYQRSRQLQRDFPYPGVNAATFHLLSGDRVAAERLANEIRPRALEDLRSHEGQAGTAVLPTSRKDMYFACATLAEIELIRGDFAAAEHLIRELAQLGRSRQDDVAFTRRQLMLLTTALDVASSQNTVDLLLPLKPAPIRLVLPFPDAASDAPISETEALGLLSDLPSQLLTSMSSQREISTAEALIGLVPIRVILPMQPIACRIELSGRLDETWARRRDAVLMQLPDAAKTVAWDVDDVRLICPDLWAYVTDYLNGLGRLQSSALLMGADSIQADSPIVGSRLGGTYKSRALIFGDVKGFSKMGDRQVGVFAERVWTTARKILDEYKAEVSNTWGDALFAGFSDAVQAAHAALTLQDEIDRLAGNDGLPAELGMRIGGHLGPVVELTDAVTDRPNFGGVNVNRAARIEPVAAVGQVWVTEPFAAAIAATGTHMFACDYLGRRDTAKGFGRLPLYRLHRR